MILSKTQLKKWSNLREQGDFTRMEAMSKKITGVKITRQTISRALETGRCNDNTFKLLSNFYTTKEELVA